MSRMQKTRRLHPVLILFFKVLCQLRNSYFYPDLLYFLFTLPLLCSQCRVLATWTEGAFQSLSVLWAVSVEWKKIMWSINPQLILFWGPKRSVQPSALRCLFEKDTRQLYTPFSGLSPVDGNYPIPHHFIWIL